jgi:hypothetical protein
MIFLGFPAHSCQGNNWLINPLTDRLIPKESATKDQATMTNIAINAKMSIPEEKSLIKLESIFIIRTTSKTVANIKNKSHNPGVRVIPKGSLGTGGRLVGMSISELLKVEYSGFDPNKRKIKRIHNDYT